MRAKSSEIILQIFALILLVEIAKCNQNGRQPKIHTYDGKLIIEAVRDKNITFRLSGDSTLFIGGVNALDMVKKASAPRQLSALEGQDEVVSVNTLAAQLEAFKFNLQRLASRFGTLQNRTRNFVRSPNIRRSLGRIRRTLSRVTQIETNLQLNECEGGESGARCKNGGTCYDGYKDFHCECPDGWKGKTCEVDVDECYIMAGTDLGCQNKADCINTIGSYSCFCHHGFRGTHCRTRTAVCETSESSELCGHGICVHASNEAGYTCLCDQGWTKDQAVAGAPCTVDVNECDNATNPCHSECINLPGSFKCGPCPRGYTGNGVTCLDVNECATNNGGCSVQPKASCVNTEGSYHCGNCPAGWEGDGRTCEQTTAAACDSKNVCHPLARCEYISDTLVCICPSGMHGHGFGSNGCTTEATTNPCDNHACQNNGTCVVEGRGTRCLCAPGYTGPTCDQADACHSAPCGNGGTCVLLPNNKYRCVCSRGTTGKNCEILRNICGSFIREESGVLKYPKDGDSYGPNERCAWIIHTSNTLILNVTFSNFDVEEAPDCNKDWLQIHDGRSLATQLIGRFCGASKPLGGNIVSSQNYLFFWFRSDNVTNGSGFNMSWHSMEYICGSVSDLKENEHGIIRSPGYPGRTPANRDCEWQLNAPFGQRFQLRFFEVNLGGNRNCSRDTLKVFDSDTLLRSICETSRPEPIHSSSNKVRLHFHTDAFGADSSFQIHFEVISGAPHCGGVFTEPRGVISGYMNAPICLYLIQQPVGTKIKLEFTNFELLGSEGCSLQKVEVFDGDSDESPLHNRLCGRQIELDPIISTGNVMLLRYEFLLTGFTLPKKFEAIYSRVCDDTFSNEEGGKFTTPNYPGPYFEHMTCTFSIVGPLNTIVHVNFTDMSISQNAPHFDLVDDANQSVNKSTLVDGYSDFVDVYLSNNYKRRYFQGTPMHLVSQNNIMRIVFHSNTNEHKARGILANYYFEQIPCGGVLTEPEGNFSYYEVSRRASPFCMWIIEAPSGKHIQLDLGYTRTATTRACDLHIYSNDSQNNDHLLGSYCENQYRIIEPFNVNLLSIILNVQQQPFVVDLYAEYKIVKDAIDCGGNFSARYGVIKSPSWPKPYGPSMECTWVISAPLGHKIELVIDSFSLETTSSSCMDDSLEIRNGRDKSSPLIGTYCGTNIPKRIPSFGNILYLHFRSDDYISDAGFYLTWQQAETGCGGLLNSYKGSVHSPHNADGSSGAVSCDWQIVVSLGSSININITRVGQSTDLCQQNLLTVYDGPTVNSQPLKFHCANNGDTWTVKSTTNRALIRYNLADDNGEGLRFFIDYETNCNVFLDSLQGVIESPNFPENYPPGLNCRWDLHGGRNNKFLLTFSHLDIEIRDQTCDYDFVELRDMLNEDELSKRHLCTKPRDVLTSEGNRFIIKFVTDYSEHARGFRAEFKRLGCGEHFTKAYGFIQSPNSPYSVDMNCDWHIEVPAGKQIILNFEELHIETEISDCSVDAIIVSEEKNSTPILLKACQVEHAPVAVTSQANRLYIQFITSETRARKYFRASYKTRDSLCGGIFRGSSGRITSPNYPRNVATRVECVWTVTVENSYGIQLQFQEFNVSHSLNCTEAFLELWKVEESRQYQLERACGDSRPLIRTVHGNQIKLVFKTTGAAESKFALSYQKECGGLLTGSVGYIKARVDESCEWLIASPEGSHIFLDILNFGCQCSRNTTCTNGLRLTNANDENELYQICTNHQSNIVIPTNKLQIYATKVELLAKYSTVQSSCGGTLTSLRGILTSPYYPQTYPSNVECIWEIAAMPGNSIELNFETLDIAKSEGCNQDFLEIRESSDRGNILGILCSANVPTDSIVAYGKAWIKFRSVEGSTGNGFKLKWGYAHTNEINRTKGIIESPPLTSIRDEEPYNWRIIVPRGQFISLDFREYNNGLNLYDGFDDIALKVDISQSPWRHLSSSNVLYLTSDNAELEKFKIVWSASADKVPQTNQSSTGCHDVITINHTHRLNISSLGYPNGYDKDLDCEWILKAEDPSEHVVFNLYEAKLNQFPFCNTNFEYLRVLSSTNLQDWHEELKICSSKDMTLTPIHVIHGTPYIKLKLNMASASKGSGFTSLVRTACGSNMTGPVGTINGRNIMRSRFLNTGCLWHIEARPGKRISFSFDYGPKVIPAEQKCQQYAVIYDGLDDNAPILPPGQICNQNGRNVKSMESSAHRVTVKYNLNWTYVYEEHSLFNLTYREYSECDGEVRLTHNLKSVNISSPNYPSVPQPHTECSWIVVGPVGETLEAVFIDRFDMNIRYCTKEFVELYDGATMLARNLGRYCTKPNSIRSTSNVLYMHYLTDINEPRNGFRAQVSIAACGGTFGGVSGEISSQGYPALGAYIRHAVCDYTIKLFEKSRMRLNFSDIDLPFDNRNLNTSDRIEVEVLGDSPATIAVWYGNVTTLPFLEVDSHMVRLRFYTFRGGNHRGFKLKYQRIYGVCFRDINSDSGIITLNNVNPLSVYVSCRWKITVPKGQIVTLEFLNLEGQITVNSTERFMTLVNNMQSPTSTTFTFFNDHDMLSKITEFTSDSYNSSKVIRSTDNFMYVRIQFHRHYSTITALKARYSSDEKSSCPRNIADTMTGSINTNNMPSSTNYFCRMQFNLDDNETLTFQITELKVSTNITNSHPYVIRFGNDQLFMPYKVLYSNASNLFVSLSFKRGSMSMLQSDAVKIRSFATTYRRHACGGAYHLDSNFKIEYPNISDEFYGQLECVWTLRGNVGGSFYRLVGNASFADSCEHEYITLYAGRTPEFAKVAKICRDSTQLSDVTIRKEYSTMIYHTDALKPKLSTFNIKAEKEIICGSKTRVKTDSPVVRINANDYKNNMECDWEFDTDSGMYLTVNFIGRFFIEHSENCSKDHLEIQRYEGGLWVPMSRLCGRDVPSSINTTANRIQLIFRTNEVVTGDGFSFSAHASCSATFTVSTEPQTIDTPDLRRSHYYGLQCVYTFLSDSSKSITARVNEDGWRAPYSPAKRCELGSFTVFKKYGDPNEKEAGEYCQDTEINAYHYLKLKFDTVMEKRFHITFELNTCGGNISQPTIIRPLRGVSENEEEAHYESGMNCVWNVIAPPDHSVLIRFKYFDMEYHSKCNLDFVAIFTGALPRKEKQIAKLCGNLDVNPPTIMVDSNIAVITAVSDTSMEFKGFQADVVFIRNCNERITLTDGNSPVTLMRNFTVNTTEELLCHFRVSAPEGYRVKIQLKNLRLNPSPCQSESCDQCNYMEVVDRADDVSKSISTGKFCANGRSDKMLLTSYRDIVLKLSITHAGQYNFEILLQIERSVCGGIQELELQGDKVLKIRSPFYGAKYPANTHCTWHIKADEDYLINFDDFLLQNVSQVTGKCTDYLSISAESAPTYICGNSTGFTMYMDKEEITEVVFHSDELYEDKGFSISIRNQSLLACNRTYTKMSDFFQYSLKNNQEWTDNVCVEDIRVPDNYTLNMYIFLDGSTHPDWNCSTPTLLIVDMNTNKTLMQRCHSYYTEIHLPTTTNNLRMQTAKLSLFKIFYFASRKTLEPGCGGVIYTPEGQIASPPYNDNRNFSECRWDLSVPAPNRVRLDFFDFNMGSSTNCDLDYVEILEVQPNAPERVVKSLCGSTYLDNFVPETSHIAIVSKKSPNFDGTGWKLNFAVSRGRDSKRQYF